MHIVHAGFDKLDLSISANISEDLFAAMDADRERAEEQRSPLAVSYGGADFNLLNYGGNGYRFILSGGPLDVHWFIKKPNARDPWGIRISVGSTLLATQGLGYARAYIDKTLARLGIRYGPHQVSIGRADFCVDILAPGFELAPKNFVIHSHANRADYLSEPTDQRSNGRSGLYTSVTIGKMPGRQVILYDKRREVIERRKPIWWDIWNATLARKGTPLLDPEDRTIRLYRVEVRAGKNLLKDRWQIRTWAQFDALFGDVVSEAFEKIRYCLPDPADSNRARWPLHPIWSLAASMADQDLTELRSHVDPDHVRYVHRDEHIRMIFNQVLGNVITLAALEGRGDSDLAAYAGTFGERLSSAVRADAERNAGKLEAAGLRYRFVS